MPCCAAVRCSVDALGFVVLNFVVSCPIVHCPMSCSMPCPAPLSRCPCLSSCCPPSSSWSSSCCPVPRVFLSCTLVALLLYCLVVLLLYFLVVLLLHCVS